MYDDVLVRPDDTILSLWEIRYKLLDGGPELHINLSIVLAVWREGGLSDLEVLIGSVVFSAFSSYL